MTVSASGIGRIGSGTYVAPAPPDAMLAGIIAKP
jgi:hypothetical protein